MKNLIKYFVIALILIIGYYAYDVFYPKTYDVPAMSQRSGTRYWNLPTGSKIGYTLISAEGKKKASPIIFLQGGPGGYISGDNIKFFSRLAKEGYDVYLYDQIGSGHSARLDSIKDYTPDRHKRDLEAIVDAIGSEKVIFIGQSWGAMLATLYIADNPGKAEKLIYTCPGPIPPFNNEVLDIEAPDSLNLKMPAHTNREANQKANNLRTRLAAYLAVQQGKKLMSDEEADNFQTYLNVELRKATLADVKYATKPEGGGGYYVQLMTMDKMQKVADPRPKLAGNKIQLLLLKGQYDNLPWGVAAEYLDVFANHKLIVVPDAGHAIAIEQPELLYKYISEFLAR